MNATTIERMTDQQREAYKKAMEVATEAATRLREIAAECNAAYVELPHKNEKGFDVLFGCNKAMIDTRHSFVRIAEELEYLL